MGYRLGGGNLRDLCQVGGSRNGLGGEGAVMGMGSFTGLVSQPEPLAPPGGMVALPLRARRAQRKAGRYVVQEVDRIPPGAFAQRGACR